MMKAIARFHVWWAGIDSELRSCVHRCDMCTQLSKSPAKSPLSLWSWPSKPWSRIHVDFAGGNAGLAAAYAARKLGIPATIVLPDNVPVCTQERIRHEGASIQVYGQVWNTANEAALCMAKEDGYTYVHPFDDCLVWEGNMSLVHELKGTMHGQPGAIVLSVGGGGLLCGVIQGLREVGWEDVPIIAMETEGTKSLNAAMAAGKLVTLPEISSVATTLGAKCVAERAFHLATQHPVHPMVVSDKQAVSALCRFADDEKMLVEPACGTALAAIYEDVVKKLQLSGKLDHDLTSVVVIVCGGSNITLGQLEIWKDQFGISST
uniref:L-serine dehydratase/L-threonine deaminase-like isoform X1 n=1 Tax=Myxine glutinosa TaxID=7769 RepID=UPI00358EFA85